MSKGICRHIKLATSIYMYYLGNVVNGMINRGDGLSMNLLSMTDEQKLQEIRKVKAQIAEEKISNAPVSEETYLDFIVKGYELDKNEGGIV